ncbi:MAG: YlbE-like family protein [Tenericutes bacterium]|nr:YlbE-like family protein [Mycoplasmatota bacterium]
MSIDLQYKIKNNLMYQKFLRENSIWYKYLNRNPLSFNDFISDMKDKYELKPSDRLNKVLNNISLIQNFLDVLK